MPATPRLATALVALLALAAAPIPAVAADDVQPQQPAPAEAKAEKDDASSADLQRVAACMKRLDRGKAHLDRAKKLKVASLRDSALEKAALTFERTLTDVAGSDSEILIVLAEETRSLLVTSLNARARLELDRDRPERAKLHNDRARKVDRDDKPTIALSASIAKELAPEAPAPAPKPVAAAQTADDANAKAEEEAFEDGYRAGLRDGRRSSLGLIDLVTSRRLCDRRYRDRSTSGRRIDRRRDRRRSGYGSGVGIGSNRSGFRYGRLHDDPTPQGTPRGRSYTTPNFAPTVGGGSRGFGPLIVDPRPY